MWVKEAKKTDFVFTPNSIYHIFSKLFDPVDLTSHLIFVKIYLTVSLCFYGFHGQNKPKHFVLRFFFLMLQTYLCGSRKPKTYFVFTPNSIYHIVSKLFDPVDLTSDFIFVKIYLTVSLCLYGFHGQNKPNILQNLFHTLLNNSIYKKRALEKKNLRRSKMGGGLGVGLTAVKDSMFFFKGVK